MLYFAASLDKCYLRIMLNYVKFIIRILYGNNITYIFLCYILLIKICYPITWKLIAQNPSKFNYFFLYKTFLFNHAISKNGNVEIVGLIATDKDQTNLDKIACVQLTKIQGHSERHKVKIMPTSLKRVAGLGLCKIEVFLMNCVLPAELELKKNAPLNSFGMTIGSQKYPKNFIQFTPSLPDYNKREVVICMSRVLTFERWQLIIATIELYKLMKVDLIVTHVQSALKSVFELMKIYENDGIISVRSGILFPFLQDMPYDPNEQTEFNGQILLAHECFYEFRESASFIALIDWDDLLVTTQFKTLGKAFASALATKPTAGYLLINKLESTFNIQDAIPHKFNLTALLTKGIMTSFIQNNEKMVIIPKRIKSFWMHYPRHMEGDLDWHFDVKRVTSNYSIMLHLANEKRVYPHEFNVSFLKQLDLHIVQKNFDKIWAAVKRKSLDVKLPTKQLYFDAINQCHEDIFDYLKYQGLQNIKICLTYSLCKLPKVYAECIITKNKYSQPLEDGSTRLIIRKEAYFYLKKNGCMD